MAASGVTSKPCTGVPVEVGPASSTFEKCNTGTGAGATTDDPLQYQLPPDWPDAPVAEFLRLYNPAVKDALAKGIEWGRAEFGTPKPPVNPSPPKVEHERKGIGGAPVLGREGAVNFTQELPGKTVAVGARDAQQINMKPAKPGEPASEADPGSAGRTVGETLAVNGSIKLPSGFSIATHHAFVTYPAPQRNVAGEVTGALETEGRGGALAFRVGGAYGPTLGNQRVGGKASANVTLGNRKQPTSPLFEMAAEGVMSSDALAKSFALRFKGTLPITDKVKVTGECAENYNRGKPGAPPVAQQPGQIVPTGSESDVTTCNVGAEVNLGAFDESLKAVTLSYSHSTAEDRFNPAAATELDMVTVKHAIEGGDVSGSVAVGPDGKPTVAIGYSRKSTPSKPLEEGDKGK